MKIFKKLLLVLGSGALLEVHAAQLTNAAVYIADANVKDQLRTSVFNMKCRENGNCLYLLPEKTRNVYEDVWLISAK